MQLRSKVPRAQRGVGLIEVLIAVLVLSFGMLGLAGLQTWSLRNNQSAMERGMATVQTYSIADVLRADRIRAINGEYNIDADDDAPAGTAFADESIRSWREALQQSLNATATGSIDCNGTSCEITVRWDDSRAQSGGQEGTDALEVTTMVEL